MKEILSIVLPVVLGIGSICLTYYFSEQTKKKERAHKFKEDRYIKLIEQLRGLVGFSPPKNKGEIMKAFLLEQTTVGLYASDDVIRSTNNFVKLLDGQQPSQDDVQKAIGNIILSMRKDLLGKTKLNQSDFRIANLCE